MTTTLTVPVYVGMDDYDNNERPVCENCAQPTIRSCGRCGQRICRACATTHKIADYSPPVVPELWRRCRP